MIWVEREYIPINFKFIINENIIILLNHQRVNLLDLLQFTPIMIGVNLPVKIIRILCMGSLNKF